MLLHYDPDEYESVVTHHTCRYHQMYPGRPYAGCTCSSSYSSRRRTPEDVARVKAERRRQEEDEILMQAEMIKVQREEPES